MSYDLRVWVTDPDVLSEEVGGGGSLDGRNWQIVVNEPDPVDPEDIPKAIRDALLGIAMVIELNLEPIHAPKSALLKLKRLARRLAKRAHGIIEDPQLGEIETPHGVKLFVPDWGEYDD